MRLMHYNTDVVWLKECVSYIYNASVIGIIWNDLNDSESEQKSI